MPDINLRPDSTQVPPTRPDQPAGEAQTVPVKSDGRDAGVRPDPALAAARQLSQPAAPSPTVTLPDGLQYTDSVVGSGDTPKPGDTIKVLYVGRFTNGQVFDSNNQGYTFVVGDNKVIKGWDEGILGTQPGATGMKPGGVRHFVIPPNLAYGPDGFAGVIPPNATLLFDVKLLPPDPPAAPPA